MHHVGIVVDSTADLPQDYYESRGILMVPLRVNFGSESYRDWIDINPETFYQKLRSSSQLPKTSQPSAAEFEAAYREVASRSEHIISIHLSSKLSGTVNSAQAAKASLPHIPISIIDTGLASVGTGMVAEAVYQAVKSGSSAEDAVTVAERVSHSITILFAVDTLEYLQKGGRIGKAQALLASVLNIKPVLTLKDGEVHPYKKVRGTKRVYQEVVEALKELESGRILHLGLAHASNPDAVEIIKDLVEKSGVEYQDILVSEIGPVIGTYTGPGAFALVFYQE